MYCSNAIHIEVMNNIITALIEYIIVRFISITFVGYLNIAPHIRSAHVLV